jgi:hypothetical protein
MYTKIHIVNIGEAFHHGTVMDNVTWVVGLPQVYGLKGDEGSFVQVMRAAVGWEVFVNPSLMDGGANICIMGILELLMDVVSIPLLPIFGCHYLRFISLDNVVQNSASFHKHSLMALFIINNVIIVRMLPKQLSLWKRF